MVWQSSLDGTWSQLSATLSIASALGLCRLIILLFESPVKPFLLMVWLYVIFNILVPAIVQESHGWPWDAFVSWSMGHALKSLAVLFFTLLVVEISYGLHFKFRPATFSSTVRISAALSQVFFFLSILISAFLLYQYGLSPFVTSRSATASVTLSGGAAQAAIASDLPRALLFFTLIIWLSRLRRIRTSIMKDISVLVGFIAILTMNIIFNNPIALPRSTTLCYFFSFLIILFLNDREKMFKIYMVVYVIAAYWISTIIDPILRFGMEREAGEFNGVVESLGTGHFSDFQMMAAGFQFIENNVDWSWHYTKAMFFFFIPRSLWEAKALTIGVDMARLEYVGFVDPFSNLAVSPIVEFYADFGWTGVAFLGVCFGWLGCWIDGRFRGAKDVNLQLIAAVMILGYLPLILRGSVLSIASFVSAALVWPTGIILWRGWKKNVPANNSYRYTAPFGNRVNLTANKRRFALPTREGVRTTRRITSAAIHRG